MATDKPQRTTTEIVNRWLGTKPFVVIELDAVEGEDYEGDDFVIKMGMQYGGGITRSGAMGVLGTMLTENGWTVAAPEGFDPDADD